MRLYLNRSVRQMFATKQFMSNFCQDPPKLRYIILVFQSSACCYAEFSFRYFFSTFPRVQHPGEIANCCGPGACAYRGPRNVYMLSGAQGSGRASYQKPDWSSARFLLGFTGNFSAGGTCEAGNDHIPEHLP